MPLCGMPWPPTHTYRYNRKLEMKLREVTAKYENTVHRLHPNSRGGSGNNNRQDSAGAAAGAGADFLAGADFATALRHGVFTPHEVASLLRPGTSMSADSRVGSAQSLGSAPAKVQLLEPRPGTSMAAGTAGALPGTAPVARASTAQPTVMTSSHLRGAPIAPPGSAAAKVPPATATGPRKGTAGSTPGTALPGKRVSLAESIRQVDLQKETERANQAEAALDVVLTERARLESVVTALAQYLSSLGHDVAEVVMT